MSPSPSALKSEISNLKSPTPEALALFERLRAAPNDNNEHLQAYRDAVLQSKAQVVVELGLAWGRSAVALLVGLAETGGKLYSCDADAWPGTRKIILDAGLAERWEFTVADDREWGKTWTLPIDVLSIDSSHERAHTEAELRLFAPHVREGGVILLHDTVSYREGVWAAIEAFLADDPNWTMEHRTNNNGLAILTRRAVTRSGRTCRLPIMDPKALDLSSGIMVALAALSQAVSTDPRFAPISSTESTESTGSTESTVPWFPAPCPALMLHIRSARPVAIGPQVLYANSRAPGAGHLEKEIMAHTNYAAIFTFSRWYQDLLRQTMAQKTRHVLLDFPLPRKWLDVPHVAQIDTDALIFSKGGAVESTIADVLAERFPSHRRITYGAYSRQDLLKAAARSRACFYVSREDHYPIAAVEIGLMGCPIISDERSCPALVHRLTGLMSPVRERDARAPFTWSPDAAERLGDEWRPALMLDREEIRRAVIRRHDPRLCVERIAAALGL